MDEFREEPYFLHAIEDDPIRENYEKRGGREKYDVREDLEEHLRDRYGKIQQKWNIGIIGYGGVGQATLRHIELSANKKRGAEKKCADIGNFYIATSQKADTEYSAALDTNVTTQKQGNKRYLGIDWHNLESQESQQTIQTIVDETDICIISGDVGEAELERICKAEGVDPKGEKRRDMITKANINWVNKIAEKFRDYKGMVLVVTNLSDDQAYAFAGHMNDPYRVVGMSYVDTARGNVMPKKVKKKLMERIKAGVPGITDQFKELTTGGDEVLENIKIYSVGTHDNPYPLIYYKGRLITELSEDEIQPIRDELKKWGHKMLEHNMDTDEQTGMATAETVIQMMEGVRPIPVSLLFDYKSQTAKEKQQCFFTVPVMFKLEEVDKARKTRLAPRPYVIRPQIDALLQKEGFRELLDQHAAKLRERMYKGGRPMFPVIERVRGDSFEEIIDLGYLYSTSTEDKANRYRVSCAVKDLSKNETDEDNDFPIIAPKSSRDTIPDLEKLQDNEDESTLCLSRITEDEGYKGTKYEDTLRILESCELSEREFKIRYKVEKARLKGGILYVGLNKADKGKVIGLNIEEDYTPDQISDRIDQAPDLVPIHTFEIVNIDGKLFLCVAGKDNKLYLYDIRTGEFICSATGSDLNVKNLKAVEKDNETVILGSIRHSIVSWHQEKGDQGLLFEKRYHELPFKTSSIFFDAAVDSDSVRLASLKKVSDMKTTLEVRTYASLDELCSEVEPISVELNGTIVGVDFVGSYITVLREEEEISTVKVFEENDAGLSKLGELRLEGALLSRGYKWGKA